MAVKYTIKLPEKIITKSQECEWPQDAQPAQHIAVNIEENEKC